MMADANVLATLRDMKKDTEQVVSDAAESGEKIFTIDSLRETTHPLALLLRLLFISKNVTREKFKNSHKTLEMKTFMSVNTGNYERNNMHKAMERPELSWGMLEKILIAIGYDIVDVSLTLSKRAEDGTTPNEVFTISKSDVKNYLGNGNVYSPEITVFRTDKVVEE